MARTALSVIEEEELRRVSIPHKKAPMSSDWANGIAEPNSTRRWTFILNPSSVSSEQFASASGYKGG
jgi:hypothetical protein